MSCCSGAPRIPNPPIPNNSANTPPVHIPPVSNYSNTSGQSSVPLSSAPTQIQDSVPTGACGMPMHWTWHTREKAVFFPFWIIQSDLALALSCIAIVLLGVAYEGLGPLRLYLDRRLARVNPSAIDIELDTKPCPCTKKVAPKPTLNPSYRPTRWEQAMRALLHGFQSFYGLFLMMIFMTYNGYLMLALVLGHTLGYFIFGTYHPLATETPKGCCS